jgi:hypothetical protein
MNSGNPPFDALLPQDDLLPDCHFCSLLLRLSNPPRPVRRVEVRLEVAFLLFLLSLDLEFRRLFLCFRQARRTLVLSLALRGTMTGKAAVRRTSGTATGRRTRSAERTGEKDDEQQMQAQVMRPQTEVMLANHPKISPAEAEPMDMKERRAKRQATRT